MSLNGSALATVTFFNPDTDIWLANGGTAVVVALPRKKQVDTYTFDASSAHAYICIPDTSANTTSGGYEYAASGKTYTTVATGCALNALTGRAQPYIHLFNKGYLLNISVNNVPLTQLSAHQKSIPVFLSAGLNVISASFGSISVDYYVRDGGSGSCTLQ